MISVNLCFERGVETLTYFSHEMAASFRKMGYQIFFFDIQAEYADTKTIKPLLKVVRPQSLPLTLSD